jgi:hypothetical protein
MNVSRSLQSLMVPLGLTPHVPRVGYDADAPFSRLARDLGTSLDAAEAGSWLRGEHRGAQVLVVPHQHDGGLGWELWTAFVAAIEPPLFLNLEMYEQLLIDPRDPLRRNDVTIGAAEFDGAVHLSAPDHQRLTWFLAPWRPDSRELLAAIARGVRRGMRITDTTVTIAVAGIPTPTPAAEALAIATWVAQSLGERRRAFASTPDEEARAHRWHELARRRDLTFDPQRMVVSGDVEGNAVELALEPTPTGLVTATTLRMPGVDPDLRLRKRHYRVPWAVTEPNLVPLGIDALDRVLVARGDAATVTRALASEALVAELTALANEATELVLDGEHLTWISAPAAYEVELEARLARGLAIARALPRAAQTPYR